MRQRQPYPVMVSIETAGARDPNDVGSIVYFQAHVRVHNIMDWQSIKQLLPRSRVRLVWRREVRAAQVQWLL